jgi:O-acetyl-ADP-ribose deacetylase (regulator of RNase III)
MAATLLLITTMTTVMNIHYRKGNMFEHDFSNVKGRKVIAHGCNMQGVMGSGVAKEFKNRYPDAFKKYLSDISNGLQLGDCSLAYDKEKDVYLASLLTQEFYGKDGKKYASYQAIYMGISYIVQMYDTIVIPKIGCGLGGCEWDKVELIIKKWLSLYPNKDLYVYSL